jgi:hypothetical protein
VGRYQFSQRNLQPAAATTHEYEVGNEPCECYPMLHVEATVISEQRGPKRAVEHRQDRLERSDCFSQMQPDLFNGGIGGTDQLTKHIAETLPSAPKVSQGSLQSTWPAHRARDGFDRQALIEMILQFLHAASAIGNHSNRQHCAGKPATRAAESLNWFPAASLAAVASMAMHSDFLSALTLRTLRRSVSKHLFT